MPGKTTDALPELLSSWAGSQPTTTAVWSRHGELTYRELDEQVRALPRGSWAWGRAGIGRRPDVHEPSGAGSATPWQRSALGGRVAAFNTWAKKWDLQHLLAESGCEVLVGLVACSVMLISGSLLRELVPESMERPRRPDGTPRASRRCGRSS